MRSPLAYIELFVVVAFLIAWGILELVARRLDSKRLQPDDRAAPSEPVDAPSRGPEDSSHQ